MDYSFQGDCQVMAEQKAVRVAGLSKWFGDFQALKNVDLTVSHGERVVICGPSGSGKSTLIRCLNALEGHDDGEVIIDGVKLAKIHHQIKRRLPKLVWSSSTSIYFRI